jgi:hypothetical protein
MPGWMLRGSAEHFERVGQCHRLLEDLLLHVMPVIAEFDGIGGQLRFGLGTFHCRAINPRDAVSITHQFGTVAVLEIDHPARHLHQCRGIRGGVASIIAQAKQQRRPFTGNDNPARVSFTQHGMA